MKEDFFSYKKHFISFILIISYVFIHFKLTGQYSEVTFDKVVDLSVRLPYGQRFLIPLLAHYLHKIIPLQLYELFFLIEYLFVSLFYFSLVHLLRCEFSKKQAQALAWLFLLLLPTVMVINYRFTIDGIAAFYFPYDTPTLFFMTLGFLFCLRAQWWSFLLVVFFATLNRESSFLLILMIPALHWQKLQSVYKQIIGSVLVYLLARILIVFLMNGIPGSWVEWHFSISNYTHFEANLLWLFQENNLLLFIFCFAGLPLFWFGFYDYIPQVYRPLRYVALLYFLLLLLVGNFFEARIFSEILILMYLPVCVGIYRWLSDLPLIIPENQSGILYYLNRYAVLAVLILTLVFRLVLKTTLEYFITN